MYIIINNREAVLKKGASFDYIAENRFFTGADSYTLTITFPLKGCMQNREIFGYINRKDHDLSTLMLDCEIHDRGFHAYGAVNIVEISDTEVKTQFLQGKSAQNFDWELDKTYINNLQLGQARDWGHFDTRWHFGAPGDEHYKGFVSLPWVNNTSGNMQNKLRYSSIAWYYWDTSEERDAPLSCQYYLIYMLERIFEECRYSYNFEELYNSPYRYLVVFNTFPYAWEIDEWAMALPHWTITELLEQIELFTNGQFEVDKKQRKVTFSFNCYIMDRQRVVLLDNVVDEHQVEVAADDDVTYTYMEQMNLKYADADHQMQCFYSCDKVLESMNVLQYSTYDSIKNLAESYKQWNMHLNNSYVFRNILYAEDIDTYFALKCYRITTDTYGRKTRHTRLQPVNVFGSRITGSSDGGKITEIGIVPVCIDHCDMTVGDCVFLDCGTYGDEEGSESEQSLVVNKLKEGEQEDKTEFFNKLYVAFWTGDVHVQNVSGENLYPLPWIDNFWVDQYNNLYQTHLDGYDDLSMRLKGRMINHMREPRYKVDQSRKFSFKFIVKDGNIPDVRSIFYIHGKKYLAEKITATFTENGMSQLVKMVAYRII
ncbi:MAG: hypothetical protein IKD19_07730 [Prevotella sp.]|nr:hypothetical protein [Prevotella sp.]